MSTVTIILLVLILIGALANFYFLFKRQQESSNDAKDLEEKLEATVNKVFGMTANKIALQSKNILQSERDTIKTRYG